MVLARFRPDREPDARRARELQWWHGPHCAVLREPIIRSSAFLMLLIVIGALGSDLIAALTEFAAGCSDELHRRTGTTPGRDREQNAVAERPPLHSRQRNFSVTEEARSKRAI